MPLTKKVMILFDPRQYKKLQAKAKVEGLSVAALVRKAVEKTILSEDEATVKLRLQAAENLVSAEEEGPDWAIMEDLISRRHRD